MRHPAFLTFPRQLLYLTACLASGLALTLCQAGLVPVPVWVLLLDGLMLGLLAGVFAYLLWFVVLYADLSNGNALQRILNHSAMLVLLLVLWAGGGYLLELLLFPSSAAILSHSLPLKVIFGLLLFQCIIRLYQDWKRGFDLQEEESLEGMGGSELVSGPGAGNGFASGAGAVAGAGFDAVVASGSGSGVVPGSGSGVAPASATLMETISVKSGQKIHLIQVPDILFLQAEGDYVLIHTPDGKFLKEQTMKFFEENLQPEHFVRIHRSCIVHTDCISKIELYEKQNYRITLKTGQQLRASAAGYKLLKKALQL